MVYNPTYHRKSNTENETNICAGVMNIGGILIAYVTLAFVFVSVCTDLRTGRIPNGWIIAGLLTGLLLKIPGISLTAWSDYFTGLFLPILIGWIPFRMRALGAGDIKLFVLIGCLNGGREVLYIILLSFLFAAGISLGRLLRLRQFIQSLNQFFHYMKNVFLLRKIQVYPGRYQKGHTIHFSIAVFLGYISWMGVNVCRNLLYL